MESDSKDFVPLSYEESFAGPLVDVVTVTPAVLVLNGTSIAPEDAVAYPLFQIAWDITSIPQKGTSVAFESLEYDTPEKVKDLRPAESRTRRLFYLVHPAGAKYREDVPAYYITVASPNGLGNISLEPTKSRVKKTEFTALLSPGRTASHDSLFEKDPRPLFTIKTKLVGGAYEWIDTEGRQVAHEGGKGSQHKLTITAPLESKIRDALVATWCLRLWHDTAESRKAKRDGTSENAELCGGVLQFHSFPSSFTAAKSSIALERLTPAESVQGIDTKWAKKAGAIGALGSLGGA
ncbi:hypothetical protein S40285_09619 [Stachybotrys chlorohalonatus IBT 40285]|uniref:Uncharacterized protein n=1 Tax=Stachybotrys chlorohalonatus (strain IBT 40285) TaxID=1283841 RepID=A0A084QLL0_STAC4|nr:hypothetical protein S40285_09619 [Stachybotrys chlorohalonata IBT 40285]